MKEVTQKEFYEAIGNRDVVLSTLGNFPFTTEFKLRRGGLVGKSVDEVSMEPDTDYLITKYFIVE
jgi:hypothetical protein